MFETFVSMYVFCCSTRLVLEIYLIAVLPLILTLKLLLSIKYIIGVVNALLISILCAKINGSKHSVTKTMCIFLPDAKCYVKFLDIEVSTSMVWLLDSRRTDKIKIRLRVYLMYKTKIMQSRTSTNN